MAKSEITQDLVNHVAETLKVNGSKPSARLVREKLGGVGSTTTILKFLQVWQASQAKPVVKDVMLPVALSKYLLEFTAKEVEDGKESLQEDLVQIQQAQSDLIVENERQVAEIEVLSSEAELAQANNAVLASQLEKVYSKL